MRILLTLKPQPSFNETRFLGTANLKCGATKVVAQRERSSVPAGMEDRSLALCGHGKAPSSKAAGAWLLDVLAPSERDQNGDQKSSGAG